MLNQLGKYQLKFMGVMEECFTFAEVSNYSTRCKVKIYQILVSSTCTITCRFMTTEEGQLLQVQMAQITIYPSRYKMNIM